MSGRMGACLSRRAAGATRTMLPAVRRAARRHHGPAGASSCALSACAPEDPEALPHLLGEQLRLLPGGEVAAAVEPLVVDEVARVGEFRPALRGLVELVGEDADGERYRDGLGV